MRLNVYLAYAIDQHSETSRDQKTLESLRSVLVLNPQVGWIYDPGQAFKVANQASPTPGIRAINSKALAEADVLVAYLPAGVVSVGVPMEIEAARSAGKLVWVFTNADIWMLQFPSSDSNTRVFTLDSPGVDLRNALQNASKTNLKPEVAPTTPNAWEVPEKYQDGVPTVIAPGAQEPRRAYPDDAGYDLVVQESVEVPPGEFRDIHCGVSMQLPPWSWGLITGRSSTLRKKNLMVAQGVIDAGYRGELFAGVWNLGDTTAHVKKGDRVAQLIIMVNGTLSTRIEPAESLDPSARGSNGFGSSGV